VLVSTKVLSSLVLGALLALPALAADPAPADPLDAVAQDDDLDDILGDTPKTTAQERRALEEGRTDVVGERKADPLADDDLDEDRRPPIKVLQKKNFLKLGRFEVGPHLGFVSNDPFINRYIFGANAGYHFTEVLSAELAASFSPDFGEGDWKPITRQIIENNNVSPDISKIIWAINVTTQFSPIYGKLAVLGGRIIIFDMYGIFGMGLTGTQDDLTAIQCDGREGEPCTITASQVHPTTTVGGGFRVAFSRDFAVRIEARTLSFIETLNGTSLEMKNNFIIQASATFFLSPGGK